MTPPRPAELPPLPHSGPGGYYDSDDMLAYGLACIESAQAPKVNEVSLKEANSRGAVAWRWSGPKAPAWIDMSIKPKMFGLEIDHHSRPDLIYAYPSPPTQPEVRALVEAVRDELESGFNVAPTPSRARLRRALSDLEKAE